MRTKTTRETKSQEAFIHFIAPNWYKLKIKRSMLLYIFSRYHGACLFSVSSGKNSVRACARVSSCAPNGKIWSTTGAEMCAGNWKPFFRASKAGVKYFRANISSLRIVCFTDFFPSVFVCVKYKENDFPEERMSSARLGTGKGKKGKTWKAAIFTSFDYDDDEVYSDNATDETCA